MDIYNLTGPYYSTVPRAYDIFKAYEGWKKKQ
jgi:hypothetical protein